MAYGVIAQNLNPCLRGIGIDGRDSAARSDRNRLPRRLRRGRRSRARHQHRRHRGEEEDESADDPSAHDSVLAR
jgi:hypothetical protein